VPDLLDLLVAQPDRRPRSDQRAEERPEPSNPEPEAAELE
jgi:hypothetical protein